MEAEVEATEAMVASLSGSGWKCMWFCRIFDKMQKQTKLLIDMQGLLMSRLWWKRVFLERVYLPNYALLLDWKKKPHPILSWWKRQNKFWTVSCQTNFKNSQIFFHSRPIPDLYLKQFKSKSLWKWYSYLQKCSFSMGLQTDKWQCFCSIFCHFLTNKQMEPNEKSFQALSNGLRFCLSILKFYMTICLLKVRLFYWIE